ncbi:MAG: hypothetical protein WBE79_02270 [Candidatus Cybelea sp.]|jgi:hypothetical protein
MSIVKTAVVTAGAMAVTAFLPACNGQAQFAPANIAGTAERSGRQATWMNSAAKSSDLIYVSNFDEPGVLVYTFPKGKLAGELFGRGAVYGLCVDNAGDVFMPSDGLAEIFKYAHGGAHPIATLKDRGQAPFGCAVDPTSGDLAVSNFESDSGGPGSISIYKNAKGKPTTYPDPGEFLYIYYIAYGGDGTLYLDGTTNSGGVGFATFKGGKFTTVTLNQSFQYPSAIGVGGSDVDVVDNGTPGTQAIDRFTISGSTGSKVGSTQLGGAYVVAGFDVVKRTVVVANDASGSQNGDVEYFKYPAGGSATKSFTFSPYFYPQAVTVSEVTK